MRIKPRKADAEEEEKRGEPDGRLDQHLRGLRAPDRLGETAAEGRAEALLLAALHQHHEAHEQADNDEKEKQYVDGGVRPIHKGIDARASP